jgi:hypothetical protein
MRVKEVFPAVVVIRHEHGAGKPAEDFDDVA